MEQLSGFVGEVEGGVDDEETPLVFGAGDHADRGVVEAEDAVDVIARVVVTVLDEMGVQGVEDASVGEDGDVAGLVREQLAEKFAGAPHERAAGFASARGEVEVSRAPAGDFRGKFPGAIFDGASFENSEAQLAQPRVGYDGETECVGQRSGGGGGAGEVAADEVFDGVTLQPGGGFVGLGESAGVERDIELAHGAAGGVVVGLAVADEVKCFHGKTCSLERRGVVSIRWDFNHRRHRRRTENPSCIKSYC